MKQVFTIFLAMAFFSCHKDVTETGNNLVDLIFTSTNTPQTVSKGGDIISSVKCYGPDLCYRFAKFDIKETRARQFDIRAKATYPENNSVVCAQALYKVDTTVSINATTSGLYVLRFFHNNTLFKADTVEVK